LSRKDRIVSIESEKFTISYAISTFPGQSGSPVCIGDKVIAIHNGGGKEHEHFNVGRIFTIDLFMTL
jgi:V8-like Glu-specific endopeptidase